MPLMAMRFAFDGGGNSQDPVGKEGLANFLSGMLDEGAGDLTAKQFQERMEEIALRMSFEDGRDAFYGSFETLTREPRAGGRAAGAWRSTRPRFDAEAIERMRDQFLASLAAAARDPTRVASEQWMALAFAGPSLRPARPTARRSRWPRSRATDLVDVPRAHVRQGHAARGGRSAISMPPRSAPCSTASSAPCPPRPS